MNTKLNMRLNDDFQCLTWRQSWPICYALSMRGTHPEWDCIPKAYSGAGRASGMVEAGGVDVNCCSGV